MFYINWRYYFCFSCRFWLSRFIRSPWNLLILVLYSFLISSRFISLRKSKLWSSSRISIAKMVKYSCLFNYQSYRKSSLFSCLENVGYIPQGLIFNLLHFILFEGVDIIGTCPWPLSTLWIIANGLLCNVYGPKYSRMNQVKFVEDSL